MKDAMRAMYYLGPSQLELREVPIPSPSSGEIVVRVKAATTCGTDVKTYLRGHPKFPPPTPFGHEFAGDIHSVGEAVHDFQPGMRVTANVFAPCGLCYYCKKDQGNLCESMVYNLGAFADYIRVPASIVRFNTFELPENLSYTEAAVLEPLISVVHGQRRASIQAGEHVAILGAGGAIGLMHTQMARLAGAAQLIAVDVNEKRLQIAAHLGASVTLNAAALDSVAAILERTQGRGADVVIECAGVKEVWLQAVASVRKGGRVLWFGGLPGGTMVEIDSGRVHYGELTLLGTHGGTPMDAQRGFELLSSRRIDVSALIQGEMPLDAVEAALDRMIKGDAIKIAIRP